MMRTFKRLMIASVTLGLLVAMTFPVSAQQANQPTVQELLQKIQQLQQQLQAQQEQNQMLQQQLQDLQGTVSSLAQTQAKQSEQMKKLPEAVAKAAPVKPGGKEKITFKGFLSTSFFMQDANFAFGNGQSAEFPVQEFNNDNDWFTGGDVRNTRLTIAFTGTKLATWNVGALAEADFFGGYNGAGPFSQQQPHLRLRLGYIELKHGGTKIRVGQDWSPLFGEWPISTSHIAFPLGYGSAGYVGWRFPGFYIWQDLGGSSTKFQFQGGIFEGSWNGPGPPTAWLSAGNVGFRPQVEARLNILGKGWKLYFVGHWDDKDLKGVNEIEPEPPIDDSITGTAFELGGKITPGHWLIHGNFYWGQGIGQQFGAITQFGDIESIGGWVQIGYNFDKHWSLYGFYGFDDPDNDDVLTWIGEGGRMENSMYNLHLRYAIGQYWFGLEWMHDTLKVGPDETEVEGNQIALSWLYKF